MLPRDILKDRIRTYLSDYKEKNKLLVDEDGNPVEETSDDMIYLAIDVMVDDANSTPPIVTRFTVEEWMKHKFFLFGCVAWILDSVSIENIRNTMPMGDGGVNIDDTYKAGPFSTHALNLWGKYEEGLKQLKIKTNLESMDWLGTSGTSPFRIFRAGW